MAASLPTPKIAFKFSSGNIYCISDILAIYSNLIESYFVSDGKLEYGIIDIVEPFIELDFKRHIEIMEKLIEYITNSIPDFPDFLESEISLDSDEISFYSRLSLPEQKDILSWFCWNPSVSHLISYLSNYEKMKLIRNLEDSITSGKITYDDKLYEIDENNYIYTPTCKKDIFKISRLTNILDLRYLKISNYLLTFEEYNLNDKFPFAKKLMVHNYGVIVKTIYDGEVSSSLEFDCPISSCYSSNIEILEIFTDSLISYNLIRVALKNHSGIKKIYITYSTSDFKGYFRNAIYSSYVDNLVDIPFLVKNKIISDKISIYQKKNKETKYTKIFPL